MMSSSPADLKIYTDGGDFERTTHEYDDDLRLLMGTNAIFLRKDGSGRIIIGVSGINCKKGNNQMNCFLFYRSAYPDDLLSKFYGLLRTKCESLGLFIDNYDFNRLFESNGVYKNVDLPVMMAPIMDNLDLIRSLAIIPSYFIPKEHVLDILDYILKSDQFNSVAYSFSAKKITGLAPDILFYYGVENEIIPNHETEEAIKAEELRRKTKPEEEKKAAELEKQRKEKEQVSQFINGINVDRIFSEILQEIYARRLGRNVNSIDLEKVEPTKQDLEKAINAFIIELDNKFDDFKKKNETSNFSSLHNKIIMDIANYCSDTEKKLEHTKPNLKSFSKKFCPTITNIINENFNEAYRGHDKKEPPKRLKKPDLIIVIILLLSLLLLGALFYVISSPQTPPPQNFTPVSTISPSPSPTQMQIFTPVPTISPSPSPTPTPEPTTVPLPETLKNSIGMEFILIPAGEFDMGSPSNEAGDNEAPIHHVNISKAFYMGKYEVTQKQWLDIMTDNPSSFNGDKQPKTVSWNDVQEFIRKLNKKEGTNRYRLPTEAEWEYAARAGTTTRYSFGDDESKLGDYAWYFSNSGSKTHEIGLKKPNPWGLYDIHGNVWEWVQDIYHNNYINAPTDGSSWEKYGIDHVIRGGSSNFDSRYSRSAYRNDGFKRDRDLYIGFRLVSSIP